LNKIICAKKARPLLLRHALDNLSNQDTIFGYSDDEVDVLMKDYTLIKERIGVSTWCLEKNLLLIANIVNVREFKMVTRIQKLWRGFNTRKIVLVYLDDIYHLQQIRAIELQRKT